MSFFAGSLMLTGYFFAIHFTYFWSSINRRFSRCFHDEYFCREGRSGNWRKALSDLCRVL